MAPLSLNSRSGWNETLPVADDLVESARLAALSKLRGMAREDGTYQGNLEAGLLFNATSVLVRRYRQQKLSAEEERVELELARYILNAQSPTGLFFAYPDGPVSREATRLALLALRRVCSSNSQLHLPELSAFREHLFYALEQAEAQLEKKTGMSEDLMFQSAFRRVLEALDDSREPRARFFPEPSTWGISSTLTALFLKSPAWTAVEACCYPFVTSMWPMLALMAEGARSRSIVGEAVNGLRQETPLRWLDAPRRYAVESLVRYLLSHQDGTGAFFYSSSYTELFLAALQGAMETGVSPALHEPIRQAMAKAEVYLQEHQEVLPDGRYIRFLGSDVWDTAGAGLAILEGRERDEDEAELHRLTSFLLEHQNADGGWPFGRRSLFTDTDSSAWALAFLAKVRQRNLCKELHLRIHAALVRALDMLEAHVSPNGGFGVWGRSPLDKAPGTIGELASIVLDVPTEDVTARVMMGLGPLRKLYSSSDRFRSFFGEARFAQLIRLSDGAFGFLKARRNPETGLWPSRWTQTYLPGTAFVLAGLRDHDYLEAQTFRKDAARTVLACQNVDGGFGESPETDRLNQFLPSPLSKTLHTISALKILRAAGYDRQYPAYRQGLEWLLARQKPDGSFPEQSVYTCFTGFYYRYPLMTQAAAVGLLQDE